MRFVKLELWRTPFWILPPITLNRENKISPLLDIDKLSEDQQEVINNSIEREYIRLLNENNERIYGDLYTIDVIRNVDVTLDGPDDNESLAPEIISVTCDEDDEEEYDDLELVVTDEDIENAKRILSKNGNTVSKIVRNMPVNTKRLIPLLTACFDVEKDNKNRRSVLLAVKEAIENAKS